MERLKIIEPKSVDSLIKTIIDEDEDDGKYPSLVLLIEFKSLPKAEIDYDTITNEIRRQLNIISDADVLVIIDTSKIVNQNVKIHNLVNELNSRQKIKLISYCKDKENLLRQSLVANIREFFVFPVQIQHDNATLMKELSKLTQHQHHSHDNHTHSHEYKPLFISLNLDFDKSKVATKSDECSLNGIEVSFYHEGEVYKPTAVKDTIFLSAAVEMFKKMEIKGEHVFEDFKKDLDRTIANLNSFDVLVEYLFHVKPGTLMRENLEQFAEICIENEKTELFKAIALNIEAESIEFDDCLVDDFIQDLKNENTFCLAEWKVDGYEKTFELGKKDIVLKYYEKMVHVYILHKKRLPEKKLKPELFDMSKSNSYIFLWMIILNRIDFAKIFLQEIRDGNKKVQLCIMAATYLRAFKKSEEKSSLKPKAGEIANEFEKQAIIEAEKCEKNLFKNKIILEEAIEGECKSFFANKTVFKQIDRRLVFTRDFFHTFFHLIFAVLLGFILLNEQYQYEFSRYIALNQTNLTKYSEGNLEINNNYSAIYYYVTLWVAGANLKAIIDLVRFFKRYWERDFLLNFYELFGSTIFYFGFTVRFWYNFRWFAKNAYIDLIVSKILLSFSFIIWLAALTHQLGRMPYIGLKLKILWRMYKELALFSFFIIIFTYAYGVSSNAILFPEANINSDIGQVLKVVFQRSYWPLFGDTNDVFDDDYCDENSPCPNPDGLKIAFIFFIVYILVVNGMLLNLLITIFGTIFEEMKVKADTNYKFDVALAYFSSGSNTDNLGRFFALLVNVPPPFNLFIFILSLPILLKMLCDRCRCRCKSNKVAPEKNTEIKEKKKVAF